MYIYIYVYIYTHIHMYIYTHTHTYIHIGEPLAPGGNGVASICCQASLAFNFCQHCFWSRAILFFYLLEVTRHLCPRRRRWLPTSLLTWLVSPPICVCVCFQVLGVGLNAKP